MRRTWVSAERLSELGYHHRRVIFCCNVFFFCLQLRSLLGFHQRPCFCAHLRHPDWRPILRWPSDRMNRVSVQGMTGTGTASARPWGVESSPSTCSGYFVPPNTVGCNYFSLGLRWSWVVMPSSSHALKAWLDIPFFLFFFLPHIHLPSPPPLPVPRTTRLWRSATNK
ncbi:hypothetical protein BC939DRAFT_246023 [Gamsiella multidivaricata]|uniref:uncharacterized protein n=1 Tax=Gamsiella multidivaricata TaxID=101098 RepID=UPI00221E845A|nr:uncharacterized protein BC939DRAFT_246023 [Gamsiella multidivaricata]KAI7819921.1 hypothetical protein BC939DRAFT_246023 [Gamsiella multidivaricata]